MLKRIELTNFMSHAHTVIEPAAGLTVLVGPNNCGKSAVVAALQILCHNENSTYVMRHGERECRVEVETNDGHTVRWTRKSSPSYTIDGQLFDRLGRDIPEQLHQALRLPKVDAGDEASFDIHFGCQKSPIFLLDSPKSAAAKFFGASSDAIRLLEMQRRHREKHTEKQRERTRLEAESKHVNAELEALQPATQLEQRLVDSEKAHLRLMQDAAGMLQFERENAMLAEGLTVVAQCQEQAETLAPLSAPPILAPVEPLASLLDRIEDAHRQQARATARTQSLISAEPPPAWHETAELASLIARLAETQQIESVEAGRGAFLDVIALPPRQLDEASLKSLVGELAAAENGVRHAAAVLETTSAAAAFQSPDPTQPLELLLSDLQSLSKQAFDLNCQLMQVEEQLTGVAAELRELASDSVCPTCGAPMDADRLLANSLGGGHVHE